MPPPTLTAGETWHYQLQLSIFGLTTLDQRNNRIDMYMVAATAVRDRKLLARREMQQLLHEQAVADSQAAAEISSEDEDCVWLADIKEGKKRKKSTRNSVPGLRP